MRCAPWPATPKPPHLRLSTGTTTVGYGFWVPGGVGGLQPGSDGQTTRVLCILTQMTPSLPQDYELFVEAVEQNTLQEFLKLA